MRNFCSSKVLATSPVWTMKSPIKCHKLIEKLSFLCVWTFSHPAPMVVLFWPKYCFDSCAKFSGVTNCGKYRKVLVGAITEVIIHGKCTNSTVVHYFWKYSRTTSSKLSTFQKTCFRVIYAINKYFLFISSTEALYIYQRYCCEGEIVVYKQIQLFYKISSQIS